MYDINQVSLDGGCSPRLPNQGDDGDKPEAPKNIVCERFKTYFRLFATMYSCPYCRNHLNVYVIKSKEVWAYPIEYTLLGWRKKFQDGGDCNYHKVSLEDKLETIQCGKTLRLFIWKLHNAVNSSIARQEKWFNTDQDAVYTSRWWPNIDAELLRAKVVGLGVVCAEKVHN